MHPSQIRILNKLLFAKELRYAELKFDPEIGNNTFQFHLDKVIKEGLVGKSASGHYLLTLQGKKLATQLDTDNNTVITHRKVSVHLFAIRAVEKQQRTLIYTRLKHPFFGKQGFPAGKVKDGEKFENAAKRELLEETGLTGEPLLFNITHYLVRDKKSGDLLDDKLFLDYFFIDPRGELQGSHEGEYRWINVSDLEKEITNPFDSVKVYQAAFRMIEEFKETGKIGFVEREHEVDDF